MRVREEDDVRAETGFEAQPCADALRDARPSPDVTLAPALADVVEQEREIERAGLRDLVQDLAQAAEGAVGARPRHLVEGVDGGQRVLVDGMAMVEVVLGEEPDPRELGQQPAQQARLVHAAEGRSDASLVAEQPEQGPPASRDARKGRSTRRSLAGFPA